MQKGIKCETVPLEVELPYTELFGSLSPVYDDDLCKGDREDVDIVPEDLEYVREDRLSDNCVGYDWEWLQEYGDISGTLERFPGLYEKCVNINDICSKTGAGTGIIMTGPTLAELNDGRPISPLIHPDMKRLHLMALKTENLDDVCDAQTSNPPYFRTAFELLKPVPRKRDFRGILCPREFDNSTLQINQITRRPCCGVKPGSLNSNYFPEPAFSIHPHLTNASDRACVDFGKRECRIYIGEGDENLDDSENESVDSDPDSLIVDTGGVEDEVRDELDSDLEDSYDNSEPFVKKVRTLMSKGRKSETEDWNPNPRKLLDIGKQIERLNKVIESLKPVASLSTNAKNKTRREKNKLASRACRLKKKAGHEANKIKMRGLVTEHEELQDLIFEIKHALVSGSKEKLSSSKLPDKAQSLIDHPVAGNLSDYVDSVLKKTAAGDPSGGLKLRK